MDTIGQVIARVKIEEAYSAMSELQLLMYAVDEYKLMVRNKDYAIKKSVFLSVDSATQSITIPGDYLSYVKLAVCVDGEVAILDYDPTICKAPEKVCNCGTPTPTETPADNWYWYCGSCSGWYGTGFLNFAGDYISGYYDPRYGKIFGAMDLRNRYGRFNFADGKIVFGGNFRYDYVIMEYLSLDTELTKDTEIDQWVVPQLAVAIKIAAEMSLKRADFNKINYLKSQSEELKRNNLINKFNWDLNDLSKTYKRGLNMIKS